MSESQVYRIWVRKVDPQNRIRLSADLSEIVSWTPAKPGSSLECVAFPGAYGQMQLAAREPEASFRRQLSVSLSERSALSDEATTEWAKFARFAAALWNVTIVFDSQPARVAITLPKESRDLALAPNAGETAVVFGMGEILEVWNGPAWEAFTQKVASEVALFRSRAEEALSRR